MFEEQSVEGWTGLQGVEFGKQGSGTGTVARVQFEPGFDGVAKVGQLEQPEGSLIVRGSDPEGDPTRIRHEMMRFDQAFFEELVAERKRERDVQRAAPV